MLSKSDFSIPSHFPSFSKLDSFDSSMDDFNYKSNIKYNIPPMFLGDDTLSPILPTPNSSSFNNFTFPELEWDDSIETEIRHRLPHDNA